jgi:outer membrane protein
MNNMGKIILAVFFSTLDVTNYAQTSVAVHAFSIQQCLDYSRQHNVQVKNALLDLEIQQQTNKSITAGALPTISATGATTDYFSVPVQPIQDFLTPAIYGVLVKEGVKNSSGITITQPTGPPAELPFSLFQKYSASGGVTLTQTLFDGQVFVGLQARKTSLDLSQKAIDLTTEMISVNIHKIYYQLIVSRTQMQQIDANIARAEKLYNDAGAMYKNGFAEKLDVDKASVQLANLQTQEMTTQRSINNGYLGLKYLLGMPVKDSLQLTDNFTEDDLKNGVLDDTAYRYESRNDYQNLELSKKLEEYNIKRYKYSYLPTLNLNAAFQKNSYANSYNFFGSGATWFTTSYAGLSLNVPIFSGLAKNANLEKSKLQLLQTKNQIEDLKNSIDNDVAQAQNKFRSAIVTLDFQKKNMELAETVYDQTKKKYESGLASNTDLTNTQTDLITAQTNFINALYDAVIAKVDYQKATGKLKY